VVQDGVSLQQLFEYFLSVLPRGTTGFIALCTDLQESVFSCHFVAKSCKKLQNSLLKTRSVQPLCFQSILRSFALFFCKSFVCTTYAKQWGVYVPPASDKPKVSLEVFPPTQISPALSIICGNRRLPAPLCAFPPRTPCCPPRPPQATMRIAPPIGRRASRRVRFPREWLRLGEPNAVYKEESRHGLC
jgi:hypothetical protein